jgi:predicted transglutaminase-like cysteine proteinase
MLGEGISIPFDGYGDCLICFLEKKPELRGYK